MSLRMFSGLFLAPAIVVAVTAVGAHAFGGALGGTFGGGLSRAGDAMRGSSPPGRGDDGSHEGSSSAQAIELARCRASGAAGPVGRMKKPSILKVPSRYGAADRRDDGETIHSGGFYDENGTYHADDPYSGDAGAGETVGTAATDGIGTRP